MHRSTATAIILLAVAVVVGALAAPVRVVSVRTEDGDVLLCERISRTTEITLVFQHSMFGGDVRETFRPGDDDELLRTRVVTQNAAAAEYYATDGRVLPVADGFEVAVTPLALPSLPFVIDHIGRHVVIVDETTVDLYAATGETTTARLAIDSRSGLASLAGSIGSGERC